jgi:purine-nucleoside/S-methyl-5'-thioadenosine phosphorylase / adenosine deaminase
VSWGVDRWRAVAGLEQRFGDRLEPPPAGVRTARQVHGRVVLPAEDVASGVTEADGLAAHRSGTRVGVWTADCVPVHLVAPDARVAVAVHCGWRGSAAGILPEALDLLWRRWSIPSSRVEAALGPSIGGCCYGVGEEVREKFVGRCGSGLGSAGFEIRGGRLYLDLRTFLEAELRALGVPTVDRVGPCTACRDDVLHSYRKGGGRGRQLSWLGWSAPAGEVTGRE